MKTIQVNASRSYDVLVGSHILSQLGKRLSAQKAAVISDRNVWALYGCQIMDMLTKSGFQGVSFVISPGENSKNIDNFLQILNFLAENRLTRQDCVIALGGGVVGDLAGFCAACYLRGIPYLQIPTSLLAMVDSSVGGKTAIDLPAGKNLAGAFYQPSCVLCDTDFLGSLPETEFCSGCAEVIKYAILFDPPLFAHLEEKGLSFDLEAVIARCICHKRDVVAQDEFDLGQRQKLNLGHTIGHAIEKESGYTLSHGQAVAIGIATMARATCQKGLCQESDRDRILGLLRQFGLPTQTEIPAERLYQAALGDKKASKGSINLIVPYAIGNCQLLPLPKQELLNWIRAGVEPCM